MLTHLEIWDSAWNVARIFCYTVISDTTALVILHSTRADDALWNQRPQIFNEIWQRVAGRRRLIVEKSPLLPFPPPIESDSTTWIRYIDVVQHLESRDRVLIPISRAQILLEDETDLASPTTRTHLVDPLTWEQVQVGPRPETFNVGWYWQQIRARQRAPGGPTTVQGFFDLNAFRRDRRQWGDPRMYRLA